MLHLSEKNRKAVEIALAGGNPLDYLREQGSKRPDGQWYSIKQQLKIKEPETYAKLPDLRVLVAKNKKAEEPEISLADAMQGMKDAAEAFFGPMETPEPENEYLTDEEVESLAKHTTIIQNEKECRMEPKITKPVMFDGMTVREMEGEFGRYRRSDIHGTTYIDFENIDKLDILSLTEEQWRKFRKEQEKAFSILGVEL